MNSLDLALCRYAEFVGVHGSALKRLDEHLHERRRPGSLRQCGESLDSDCDCLEIDVELRESCTEGHEQHSSDETMLQTVLLPVDVIANYSRYIEGVNNFL